MCRPGARRRALGRLRRRSRRSLPADSTISAARNAASVKRNMPDFTSRESVCAAAHSLISTATATNRNILWNITLRRFFLLGHRTHCPAKPARRHGFGGEMLPKHADFREKCVCIRAPRAEDRCGIALHSAQETALERSCLRAETQRRRRESRSGSLGTDIILELADCSCIKQKSMLSCSAMRNLATDDPQRLRQSARGSFLRRVRTTHHASSAGGGIFYFFPP